MPQETKAASCYLFCANNHTKKILLSILKGVPGVKTKFLPVVCEDNIERELCLVPNLLVATEFIRNQRKTSNEIRLYTASGNNKPKAWSTTAISKPELLAKVA